MRALAVIPVRMSASRLPGKPLADLGGRSVMEWVYRRTHEAGLFDRIVLATPDEEIVERSSAFGAECILTSSEHGTGTDRVAEVSQRLPAYDVVANVQGDQPFVSAGILRALLTPYENDSPEMVTIGAPLSPEGYRDEHTVKVLVDQRNDAVYFSRAAIPHGLDPKLLRRAPVHHHLGLYAFRASFLRQYSSFAPTALEEIERLEQLRVLEHGHRIRVVIVREADLLEINTESDLVAARARMEAGT